MAAAKQTSAADTGGGYCFMEGCNKKLTLLQQTMACRCGGVYCDKHAMPEVHNCTFDFKAHGR